MRIRPDRNCALCLKVTRKSRHVIEQLAARLTIERGVRYTMTDVVEEAVDSLARKMKVKT